jgi:CheY-like chemotaxis protein
MTLISFTTSRMLQRQLTNSAMQLINSRSDEERTSPRVLVIDQDPKLLARFKRLAEPHDLEVHTCQSLAELCDIKSLKYDVIVVDAMFRGIPGVHLPAHLDSLLGNIPILLVVGDTGARVWQHWPQKTVSQIRRDFGINHIIDAAINLHPLVSEQKHLAKVIHLKCMRSGL